MPLGCYRNSKEWQGQVEAQSFSEKKAISEKVQAHLLQSLSSPQGHLWRESLHLQGLVTSLGYCVDLSPL